MVLKRYEIFIHHTRDKGINVSEFLSFKKGKAKAVACKKKGAAGPSEDGVGKMAKEMEVKQGKSVKPSQDDHTKKV
ncbi:hypothetical protein BRARA_J00302 [Brassica rapa]|uniref:Uncharacterized protein n=1 Tax=Brassica campestris TaxID=3711 RepID=A0A397XHW1_BRACM|nr:hypothetical protein BRARA_J00302 [Brassica rapa]